MAVDLVEGLEIGLHLAQHLLEVEEEVEDACRVADCLGQLTGFRALYQIFEHVNHVVDGAQVQHNTVKSAAMGATSLDASANENDGGHWQDQHEQPLGDLLHDDAIIGDQVYLLRNVMPTALRFIHDHL